VVIEVYCVCWLDVLFGGLLVEVVILFGYFGWVVFECWCDGFGVVYVGVLFELFMYFM